MALERYGADVVELQVVKRVEDDAKLSMRLADDWTRRGNSSDAGLRYPCSGVWHNE